MTIRAQGSPSYRHRQKVADGSKLRTLPIEDLDDLAGRNAQTVLQPRRECDGAVAERAVGQGVGNLGFNLLLAAGTPVAVNRVLGDLGRQVFGDVFDNAGAFASGAFERSAAVGARGQLVRLVVVDLFGLRVWLSWSNRKMTAARSRGRASSICV